MTHLQNDITQEAISLLKRLIAVPSFSKEENKTADIIHRFLCERNIASQRSLNNVWAKNKYFDPLKFTLLLNSHHDTVKPNSGYTYDPFEPLEKGGKLYGLGSNDAGASLVSLLASFLFFFEKELPFNLIFAASAEEEISGPNGIECLLKELPRIDAAIVGEPTGMQMAVAEKGLLVIEAKSKGKAGHAARNEGENAIYKAMDDIRWLSQYVFPKVSPLLGPVHAAVTSISTENKAHNVIPGSCDFIIDIRVNELFSFDEILALLRQNMHSELTPRSMRLRATSIDTAHPLVRAGTACGFQTYGSPTLSDKALMQFPALKIGPGESSRSHTADEFIYLDEVADGIKKYILLLQTLGTQFAQHKINVQ